MAKRRVLYVVNVGWFFISHRLPIAVAAKHAGYEVHLAATLDARLDQDTPEILSQCGVILHRLRLSRNGSGPLESIRDMRDLARLYRTLSPDIVHLVALKPVLLGGMCARMVGLRNVVLAIPGRGSVFSARGWFAVARRWIVLMVYRLAYAKQRNRVIIQNVEDRQYFVSRRIFAASDVRLIRGSGVDLKRFTVHPERPGAVVIVFASRMLREKGVEDFVNAAMVLQQRAVRARWVLVGEPDPGNPQSHTAEELNRWADRGVVEWCGFRADMDAVFAACHLVCLPTYYGEGVPKVLIEAAACGRAIITTNTPGCRDIVRDGYNGLLVPPRDVAALADAMQRLIGDQGTRTAMGARGRLHVEEQFSVDTVVRQTLDLYNELV